jgi:hypothetical protein
MASEAVAVAVHLQDVNVVREATEQCTGEPLGVEDGCPVLEGEVRCHDRGASLVALRDDLEQELGSGLRERHVAKLVDDQELQLGEG